MNNSYIKAIASYLPEKIITNEDLVFDFPEWSVQKIADKIGVKERHVADENETAREMAVKAAEKLFDLDSSVKRQDIDYILFCTQSPDYFLPTSACLIQKDLGLRTDIGALDFNLGCSGYIYGLSLAKGLIAGGIARNVLLLTGETYTKHLHSRDKGNRTIFGDGATATVISTSGYGKIGNFALGTDGEGANNLIVKTGGFKHKEKVKDLKFDENGNPVSSDFLFMNGSEIFTFTQRNVPKVVNETLESNGFLSSQIELYIFHQANCYMLEFLRKKLKIGKEQFIIDMSDTGNTVSNSIPIVLEKLYKTRKLKGNVLLCGFGVGYSWGGCVVSFVNE